METILIRNTLNVNGKYYNDYRTLTADAGLPNGDPMPAGVAGVAGAAGVMTLAADHGLTVSDIVMCTWLTNGGGRRYNCTITLVDGAAVTLATGAGDSLPTSGAVVVAKKVTLDVAFDGDNLAALHLGGDKACLATVEDGSTVHLAVDIAANGSFQWDSGNGVANPILGDTVTKANFYSKTVEAGTAEFYAAYNNAV